MLITKSATTTLASNYYLRFADVYTGCDDPKTTSERFTGNNAIAASPVIKLNQWYHVVWTSDGTTERIYVNCELRETAKAGGVPFSNGYSLYFGCQNSAQFPYWLNGDLDEIRIYDRALNKGEILALCDPKPETKKPEYVKAKEKNKSVNSKTKQEDKPAIAKASAPLITTSNQENVEPGFVKLSTYENEQEVLLRERKKETTREITVDNDSVTVILYDNGDIDGDSITLIYNDKIITTHQRLTDKPLTFIIKITPGANKHNELIMYAENLGSIPPNTALMVIYDGNKRYEVNIKSTEKTNGSVSFRLRE